MQKSKGLVVAVSITIALFSLTLPLVTFTPKLVESVTDTKVIPHSPERMSMSYKTGVAVLKGHANPEEDVEIMYCYTHKISKLPIWITANVKSDSKGNFTLYISNLDSPVTQWQAKVANSGWSYMHKPKQDLM